MFKNSILSYNKFDIYNTYIYYCNLCNPTPSFSSIAKVNLLIIPLVVISIIFLFVANIKNFSLNNIFPIFGDGLFNTFVTGLGNLGAFGGITLLYFLPPYLKEPQK